MTFFQYGPVQLSGCNSNFPKPRFVLIIGYEGAVGDNSLLKGG